MRNRYGGVREDNPRTRPWREAVAWHALDSMRGREMLDGPCEVHATFRFPRPKGHYRTGKNSHLLRESAPSHPSGKPDADKLQRAAGDSMTGIVMRDDAQICHWDVWKVYGTPGVTITVTPVRSVTSPVVDASAADTDADAAHD